MKNSTFRSIVIAVVLLLSGFCTVAKAQNNYVDPRFQFGLRGGFALSSGGTTEMSWCYMPTLGLSVDWKVGSIPLYIGTGLWVNAYYDIYDDIQAAFKIPALASWHFRLNKNASIGPFAGLYFAPTTGFGTENNNNFDFGVRLGCQFNWKKLYASMGYDVGCLNRDYYADSYYYGSYYYNTGTTGEFFITIGVNFISR